MARKAEKDTKEYTDYLQKYGVKNTTHYVDNKVFLEQMKLFKEQCKKNKELGLERPEIPEFVANAIIKISTHLAFRPNFYGYTFRDDMVGAGIENCIAYIENFDPEKSNNPFAYFTTVCWYAFIREIKLHRRQSVIKGLLVMDMSYDESLEIDSDLDTRSVFKDLSESMSSFIDLAFAEKEKKKKKAKAHEPKEPANNLTEFIDFGGE